MKKLILFLFPCLVAFRLEAQRCLDISVAAAPALIALSSDAAASFKDCETKKTDHAVLQIANYGENVRDLDTPLARNSMAFTIASVGNSNAGMAPAADAAKRWKFSTVIFRRSKRFAQWWMRISGN